MISSKLPQYGSSPQTRGMRDDLHLQAVLLRFIPACAGNACASAGGCRRTPVHPRICGEHLAQRDGMDTAYGSSPHTRGTQRRRHKLPRAGRFIPAYAGNAQCSVFRSIEGAVHPRIRGERSSNNNNFFNGDGSSPHTRGTRGAAGEEPGQPRFIPAYAGNAAGRESRACPRTVHPRIRGERMFSMSISCTTSGSSPHTRGTRVARAGTLGGTRFIPAYAGNAGLSSLRPAFPPVHPRIRGERTPNASDSRFVVGSSPHTRGTHKRRIHSVR